MSRERQDPQGHDYSVGLRALGVKNQVALNMKIPNIPINAQEVSYIFI